MKRNVFLFFIVNVFVFSCSTDQLKDAEETSINESAIVGAWRLTEFEAADMNSSTVNLGAEILDNLTADGCYILFFDFNQDLSVVATSGINYLEINATPSGLTVPCPSQTDKEEATYSYDGAILTTVDETGETSTVRLTISGNTMKANAKDLNIPNFDGDGLLVFEKY